MTSTQARSIISQLVNLTPEELAEIEVRVGALLVGRPVNGMGSDEEFVLGSICEVMRRIGADFSTPPMLRRAQQFTAMKAKIAGLTSYLQQALPDRVRQRALLSLAIELLARDLQRLGIAVSARVIMSHLHRIPATIDKHFPAYHAAGLLPLVIKNEHTSSSSS